MEKTKKIKKAPGFYKKIITEKKLEKKYLKFIGVPLDKTFIKDCYEQQEDGLHIRRDLGADDVKRLKTLAADIKKNRKGPVNFLPLVIIAAIAAGVVFFFSVLANPLLGKALEMGLEAVFEAKAEVRNFRLSILKFEISMSGLTIADRDSPMKNLIQFDRMAIRMKPGAVLRGKIYIEEIRADAIRFGTERTVSGHLPGRQPKVKEEKEPFEIPQLVDLANFDAMALLNEEFNKLRTPQMYEEAMEAFDIAAEKWKGQADSARARVAELQEQAKPLLALNINDYKSIDTATIERITTTVSQIETMTNTVQRSVDEVNGMVTGAQNDFNTASNLVRNASSYITEDLDYLKSYVDLSSGSAMGFIEPVIRNLLTDTTETYLEYGMRALEILEKIKEFQSQLPKQDPKEQKEKKEKFRGRDVVYPVWSYPVFYLGNLTSDVLTPGDWHWGFDLRSVSSDPDLSGTPTTLGLTLAESGDGLNRSASFNGMVDFRSGAGERYAANLSGGGFPVSLDSQLRQAGIGSFSGNASFDIGLTGLVDGSFTGSGDISVINSRLNNASNTITQAISVAITEVPSLDLGLDYKHYSSSRDNFSVTTNINDIVMAALGRIVEEYKGKAFAEIEKVLNEKISSFIDGVSISQSDMESILKIIQGDKTAMDQLKNTLTDKKGEFERYATDAVQQAAEALKQQVVDEVKTQGQQAVQDILQGNTPSVTIPTNIFGR